MSLLLKPQVGQEKARPKMTDGIEHMRGISLGL